MPNLPPKNQQIIQAHAGLIHHVVKACNNRLLVPELEPMLQATAANGWTELVSAVRQVLSGRRDTGLLRGLDEEDRVIVEAILRGLQDPATLPSTAKEADPAMAAPGLAFMIDAANKGNVQALQLIAHMAEQMTRAGGDMSRLGGVVNRLIEGERDSTILARGMSARGRQLILSILEELAKLNAH